MKKKGEGETRVGFGPRHACSPSLSSILRQGSHSPSFFANCGLELPKSHRGHNMYSFEVDRQFILVFFLQINDIVFLCLQEKSKNTTSLIKKRLMDAQTALEDVWDTRL
jgi:hypothetical protein